MDDNDLDRLRSEDNQTDDQVNQTDQSSGRKGGQAGSMTEPDELNQQPEDSEADENI